MKKILLGMFLTASFSAVAAPVYIYPSCNYSAGSARCTFANNSGKDINCSFQVSARTQKFQTLNAYETRFLYPGMMSWVTVYNYNQNDPITNVQGNASCNIVN